MVNVVAALKRLLYGLTKLAAGLTPQRVEIEPGTVLNIWVPKQTVISTSKSQGPSRWSKPNKPAVVLAHPFATEGITMWFFQALALSGTYAVYVPDFLFFGDYSTTSRPERSSTFQAECLAKGLRKVGVERCTVVGLSYGGMVGFKMAEMYPDLVEALVASSAVMDLTESITGESLAKLGFSSWTELLLPVSVEGVKSKFKTGMHKLPWLPDFFYKNYLEVMLPNRKEKAELLEALVVSDQDTAIPNYPQSIHFLWGKDDKIFSLELANAMKGQLGDKATLQYIENAGHLVQLERPFAYNRRLKKILASLHSDVKLQ